MKKHISDYEWRCHTRITNRNFQKESPRKCESCDILLLNERGMFVRHTFATDHGLFCSDCLERVMNVFLYPKGKRGVIE